MYTNWVSEWIQEFTFKINPYFCKKNRFKICIKNVLHKFQV